MTATPRTSGEKALLAFFVTVSALIGLSLVDAATTQWLFVHTTYYALMALVLTWLGTHLAFAADSPQHPREWVKDNWRGLVAAGALTVAAALAVEPALRMLSDEANLVGTSKNLFASKQATFTVSGKNYYGNYWDVDVAIDQRPALFPFVVSLVHAALGYSYTNVFVVNLVALFAFAFVAYRLAKALGGETFAVAAALLVPAHPSALIAARSGGFDLFASLFALLVVKGLVDYDRERTASRLAILWLNACMFAQIRYESALFLPLVVGLLLLFKAVAWDTLRPYAFVYALTPVFLAPRIWQTSALGSVPPQEPGAVTFSVGNFLTNVRTYFEPLLSPFFSHPHSALLIGLGICGVLAWLRAFAGRARGDGWRDSGTRLAVFVGAWMGLQAIILFSYVWGRSQFPSAARLFVAVDAFFSFGAAWFLTVSLQRWRPFVAVLLAAGILVTQLPVASQHRLYSKLTQTRESAVTWSFFDRLGEKRILIVTDRPNHFTIMNYGAMNFESARRDAHLFTALERRLFQDVYVIQRIRLSTLEPLPGYGIWPERRLESVLEFQNDADEMVRVSRLAR